MQHPAYQGSILVAEYTWNTRLLDFILFNSPGFRLIPPFSTAFLAFRLISGNKSPANLSCCYLPPREL